MRATHFGGEYEYERTIVVYVPPPAFAASLTVGNAQTKPVIISESRSAHFGDTLCQKGNIVFPFSSDPYFFSLDGKSNTPTSICFPLMVKVKSLSGCIGMTRAKFAKARSVAFGLQNASTLTTKWNP